MIQFQLDKRSAVPFYRQIVDQILAGISGGAIVPGDKLPTIRELAVRLEVNPNTVVKAYSHLTTLGVLDTQQGSGVFVSPPSQPPLSADQRRRLLETLCGEFVSRAQLLNINVDELIDALRHLRTSTVSAERTGTWPT